MKLKKNSGYIVHSPLTFLFQVKELGGSAVQKYSSLDGVFTPDRSLTPYVLQPELKISDPDGKIPTGDYTSFLTNAQWTVTYYSNGKKTDSVIGDYEDAGDSGLHRLTFSGNLKPGVTVHLEYYATYLDKTRGETTPFKWDKWLGSVAEDVYNTSLRVERQSGKLRLYALKDAGNVVFNVQLANGGYDLADSLCVYQWQKWDETGNSFVDIDDDDLWYVSGKDTRRLVVEQKYVNKIKVRVVAYPTGAPEQKHYKSYLVRRWYGQWEEDAEFTYGKYLFDDTKEIGVEASVTNHNGGDVANPQKYFDVELFYRKSATAEWESLGYAGKAAFERPADATEHQIGVIVRELTALQPVALPDGTIFCDTDGNPLVGQFPTSEREVE